MCTRVKLPNGLSGWTRPDKTGALREEATATPLAIFFKPLCPEGHDVLGAVVQLHGFYLINSAKH